MGVYDRVELAPAIAERLPGFDAELFGTPAADVEWQTKSLDDPALHRYRITADGYLEREQRSTRHVPPEERPYPDADPGTMKAGFGSIETTHEGWERVDFHGTFEMYRSFHGVDADRAADLIGVVLTGSDLDSESEDTTVQLGYDVTFAYGRLVAIENVSVHAPTDWPTETISQLMGEYETFTFEAGPDLSEPVAVERTWMKATNLCIDKGLRSDPPELEGLRQELGLDRAAFEERLAERDGTLWFKQFLSYHDPSGYHAFDDDEIMDRERAEEMGADPCPVCFPDHEAAQWADVTQTSSEEGDGTTTMVTPTPQGSAAEDGAPDPSKEQGAEEPFAIGYERPDEERYFATAQLLYTEFHPRTPEAGRMRTIDEQHEFLQEIGADVAIDPDGTVHLGDVPEEISVVLASVASSMGTPLHEIMGFEEIPHDASTEAVQYAVRSGPEDDGRRSE